MRHPFELELSDLEAVEFNVVEDLTDEEAANIGGGRRLPTFYFGEDGSEPTTFRFGEDGGPIPRPKPDVFITLALGEEG